jgi:MFS family permease
MPDDRRMSRIPTVRLLAFCTFIGGLGGGLVFPILPALGLQLGIPGFMIGLILSANRISRLAFNIPAGRAIGRLGPRITLSGALLLETLGVLSYSAALHFGHAAWWLMAGRAIFGIGTAFLFVGAQTIVLGLSARADRGRKISTVRVAMSAAMPCGLILGGILADLFSNDAAFLTGAAITFTGSLLAALTLPRRLPQVPSADRAERIGIAALLASPNLPVLAAAWGFNMMIFLIMQGALLSTMVLLVQERGFHLFGMEAQGTSGLIMAVLIGCSALVALGIGRAIDVVPLRSTLLVPALVGLAAGFAVLAVAQTLETALVGAVLVGLSYNGVTLPMMALLGDAVNPRQYGSAVGIHQVFADIGGTMGPVIGIEAGTHLGVAPLYLSIAAVPALALLAALWLRRREARLRPQAELG